MLDAIEDAAEEVGEPDDVESVEEAQPLLDKFFKALPHTPLHELEDLLLEYEKHFRELLKELGPGRLPPGYFVRQIIVAVCGHFGRIISDMWPEGERLHSADGLDFSIETASLLFPQTWGRPTYDVLFYDQLLDHNAAHEMLGPSIRPENAEELRRKALVRLAAVDAAIEQSGSTPERVHEQEHLAQIAAGFYPAPFSLHGQQRWLSIDTSYALEPGVALRNCFQVNDSIRAHLQRLAEVLVKGYEATPVGEHTEQNEKQMAMVREFMENGQVPEPWHI